MGARLGVDYRKVRGYEEDGKQPEADILKKYTEIFSVTFEYLYYGTEISDIELYSKFTRLSPKQKRAIMTVIDSY